MTGWRVRICLVQACRQTGSYLQSQNSQGRIQRGGEKTRGRRRRLSMVWGVWRSRCPKGQRQGRWASANSSWCTDGRRSLWWLLLCKCQGRALSRWSLSLCSELQPSEQKWATVRVIVKVIDLCCQEGLCRAKDAHGKAKADMAGPGEGEVGGEPDRLPRAADHNPQRALLKSSSKGSPVKVGAAAAATAECSAPRKLWRKAERAFIVKHKGVWIYKYKIRLKNDSTLTVNIYA